jgi:hypothetical protein
MTAPHIHLAYAPQGAGLLYAVTWLGDGDDVHGWYLGTRDGVPEAAYFTLPRFYADQPVLLWHSKADDLYGPWVEAHGRKPPSDLPHGPPVPQGLCHRLAAAQDSLMAHWLYVDDDPGMEAARHATEAAGLPVRHVNIRPSQLGKLHPGPITWTYDSPGADRQVLEQLSKHWPLDARVEG